MPDSTMSLTRMQQNVGVELLVFQVVRFGRKRFYCFLSRILVNT